MQVSKFRSQETVFIYSPASAIIFTVIEYSTNFRAPTHALHNSNLFGLGKGNTTY